MNNQKCKVCNKDLDEWEVMWNYDTHIECEEQENSVDYDISTSFDAERDLIWS